MTLDDLWRSDANAPTAPEREAFIAQALARVATERRRRRGLLAFAATIATLVTVQALVHWLRRPGDFSGGGSLALMLGGQWLLIAYWVRQLRRPDGGPNADGSIRASIARLLAEVEAERRSQLAVVALYAAFVPLIALAIRQLIGAGKMAPDEARSAAALFALVASVSCGAILWRLARKVLPRRRRLMDLARQYHEEAGGEI